MPTFAICGAPILRGICSAILPPRSRANDWSAVSEIVVLCAPSVGVPKISANRSFIHFVKVPSCAVVLGLVGVVGAGVVLGAVGVVADGSGVGVVGVTGTSVGAEGAVGAGVGATGAVPPF